MGLDFCVSAGFESHSGCLNIDICTGKKQTMTVLGGKGREGKGREGKGGEIHAGQCNRCIHLQL